MGTLRVLAVAALLSATPALAQTALAQTGPGRPLAMPRANSLEEALVQLRPGIAAGWLAQQPGVQVRHAEGRPLSYGSFVLVRAMPRVLGALRRSRQVERVVLAPRPGRLPLDVSAERIGLAAARGLGAPMDDRTGEGVVIGDIDSLVDVYHPDFFRADAGWVDWIDVDEDGVYTPGVDAIDANGDGSAGADETGSVLRAFFFDFYGSDPSALSRPGFDPAVDWVYLDSDGDGERTYGGAAGYDDSAPAFGEPIFVPDDVDGDGFLEPEERLVRLGSSKIRALYAYVSYPGLAPLDHVYRRGTDLSSTPADVTGGVYGYSDTLHGTGVGSILGGGVALPSRRHVGVAPDAELVFAFELGDSSDVARMVWAYGEAPDVMLHEYVSWGSMPLDGSDAWSALIDESSSMGVLNVCPAGNIGGMDKHTQVDLDPSAEAPTEVAFEMPGSITTVYFSLHARGEGRLTAEIEAPDGSVHSLMREDYVPLASDVALYVLPPETTERDTQMLIGAVSRSTTTEDTWTLRVATSDGPLTVHGMLEDEAGFALSTRWTNPVDASNLAAPSTADSCIAVGAAAGHAASAGPWYEGGGDEVARAARAYSARGPRIDGDARPHLLAPDNPWVSLGTGDQYPSQPGRFVAPSGAYAVFGGTSGAGPHVAGVGALLIGDGMPAAEVLGHLGETAEAAPGVEFAVQGHGHMDAAAAFGGARGAAAPTVTLAAEPAIARPGDMVHLVATVAGPNGEPVTVRWDDGYDGDWDGTYGATLERDVLAEALGVMRFKVRARSEAGPIAEAVTRIDVVERLPTPDMGPGADAGPTSPGADAGPTSPGNDGCGCGVTQAPSGAWPLGLVLFVLGARRRRGGRP